MDESQLEQLIDAQTDLFLWPEREDRLDLYQTGLGWPVLTTTIDGFGVAAPWQQAFGMTRTATLFLALDRIAESWTGFYIKHHEDDYAEIDWIRKIESETSLNAGLLSQFEENPADQGGASFLGLCLARPEDMILFSYVPGEHFRISLFGILKERVPAELQRGVT